MFPPSSRRTASEAFQLVEEVVALQHCSYDHQLLGRLGRWAVNVLVQFVLGGLFRRPNQFVHI